LSSHSDSIFTAGNFLLETGDISSILLDLLGFELDELDELLWRFFDSWGMEHMPSASAKLAPEKNRNMTQYPIFHWINFHIKLQILYERFVIFKNILHLFIFLIILVNLTQ